MSVSPLRGFGLLAPVLLFAQAAHADLSAQEVWSDWKAYLAQTGYAVSASEAMSGTTLTVSDIALSMEIEGDAATVTLGTLQFIENGDGTVNVVMPAELPIGYEFSADGDTLAGTLVYAHDGSPMVVSGDTSRMEYAYRTPSATMTLENMTVDGEAVGADVAALTVTLTEIDSNTVMDIGAQRSYSQNLTTAALAYDFKVQNPESGEGGTFSGALQGLKMDGTMVFPALADPSDIAALIRAGMSYAATFSFDSGTTSINGVDGEDSFALQTSSQGATVNADFGPEGVAYDFIQRDATLNLMGSDIPFPIALSMAEFGVTFAMPLAKSDDEQDFALGLALRDFAVPETLWGLIDPTGELPHDPATLVVDLSGKGKLFVDLVDEAQMAAVESGEEIPGELNAITINEILFSAVGAELTGSGAFTFDNSDLVSFDGFPAPEGEALLQLTGANALIDTLIGMGLLSDDDAMGARMMMGIFAVPAGDDVLTSKIEVNAEGHVLANGQRLK